MDSSYLHFLHRKRLDKDMLTEIDSAIVDRAMKNTEDNEAADDIDKDSYDTDKELPSNQGKLIIDATCTPADIAFPTDLSLLNEAREKSGAIIDLISFIFCFLYGSGCQTSCVKTA